MKIEHVAINVEKPTEMVQWYKDNFGMKVARANNDANETFFIIDDAGQVILEVYNNPASPMPDYATMNPLMFHIAFSVTDIESERDKLAAAGAIDIGEISTTPANDQLLFLRDPWSVPLQLVKRATPLVD